MVQKVLLDNEPVKQDADESKILPEPQAANTSQIVNGRNASPDQSFQISQSFTIDHQDTLKDPQSSVEPDAYQWSENSTVSLPKNHLEDALFQFLQQANLLQYYSAFIEQGTRIDSLKLPLIICR